MQPIFPAVDPAPGHIQALAAGLRAAETRVGNRKATGSITWGANIAANATVTIDGVVFTAVASGATGNQFNVGGSLSLSLDALVTKATAALPALTVAKNGGSTGIDITSKADGEAGNAVAIASSSGTASAATLAGGASDRPISGASELVYLVTTTGGNMTFALPDGGEGQETTLYFHTKGGSSNAVVSGTFPSATTATFDAAGDFLRLKWMAGAWRTLLNNGSVSIA